MSPHRWRKGRNRQGKQTGDPLRSLELLTMADATSRLANGVTPASVAHLCGIRSPVLEELTLLIQPAQTWAKLQLVSVAPQLTGTDLSELERLFRGVERALTGATPQQWATIKPFTTSLVGPAPPLGGFSDLAVSGAKSLFALARLGQHNLEPVPRGTSGTTFELNLGRPATPWAKKCWLEAVSLGLLKARVRYQLSRPIDEVARPHR